MPIPDRSLLTVTDDNKEAWQPGQEITTPGTRLRWRSLAGWVEAWETIHNRRVSAIRYEQENKHVRALPLAMIDYEADPDALYAFLAVLDSDAGVRPVQGERAGHPTTEMVVAANNRLAALGAVSYRQHRRRRGVRRALRPPDSDAWRPREIGEAGEPHLSLF